MSLVSKNIFWLTMSRVAALGLLFLAYAQLFRYLGPFGSGQYQFVLSYVLIFSTIVDFGVQQFIIKKMSEEPENTKKLFHNFFAFEVVVALFLYASLILIAYFRHYDPVVFKAVIVTGLGMVASALTYPFLSVMTAKQDLRKVAFINFINSLVNISVIFLAIYFKKYIIFLASIQLVFGVIDLVLYSKFIKKHLPEPEVFKAFRDFDFSLIKNIFLKAWPFALLVGFSAIYNRIDVIIITKMLGYEQTGLYTAAYKFLDILNFFPASVSHALFPVLAALMATNSLLDVKATIEKYLRLMIFAALPIAVGGMVLSTQLMNFIAGKEFKASAPILSILIWAAAILFIYIPVNSLIISQLTKKAALITGINMFINIAGNILLIGHFNLGLKAAAFMTIVSEGIQCVFYFYFVRKNIIYFEFFSLLWQPVLAAGVMGGLLYLIRDGSLLYSVIAGGIIYVIALAVLGYIKKEDINLIKNIFKSKAEQSPEPINP